MRTIPFPDGRQVPALGQGTWLMGEDPADAADEARALLAGLDAGMTLIDTAEMYGDGATEAFLGRTFAGRRDDAFLVSKVYPQNASRERLPVACEGSLRRLATDRLDLYLLHWPGSIPLTETVEAMERLVEAGKIRAWGVSNFDTSGMDALVTAGGAACATNQVLYNVTRRGPEFDLVPWMARHTMPMMAYSPVEQGRLPSGGVLGEIAAARGVSSYQVALAWVLRSGAIAIPKAASLDHVRENRAAADLVLSSDELARLDGSFPPPAKRTRLEML